MRLFFLLLLVPFLSSAQITDTIVLKNYTAYVSRNLGEPVFVSYKLYQGGGDCSRAGFRFKNDREIYLVGDAEYLYSGYDKGHLVNAEDFAYDCELDELTFRYYNCLPQTPNLNRGIWKSWETNLRKVSQQDSLLILCGGVWTDRFKGNMPVPTLCWKVVKNLRTRQVEHVLIFSNENKSSEVKEWFLEDLEKMLGFSLPLN